MLFRKFTDYDRDTQSQPQNEEGPSRPSFQMTSARFRHNLPSLKHQRRSDRMVSLRDYEIYLLFLLLVKFHGSGKCEVILPYKGFDNIFFTMCHFKL